MTLYLNQASECVDFIIKSRGNNLIVGAPLGIGKPNPLVNSIWKMVKINSSINLEIFTALSLQVPKGRSFLEKKFLKPFTDRIFGEHYPNLSYLDDVIADKVPTHMKLTEFYMQSGKMLSSNSAQKNYTSSNYTHAARDMLDKGLNVLTQMVAVKQTPHGLIYSLSSNTDLTLDIDNICRRKNLKRPLMVAMVNPNMPFMSGQAQVKADFFDAILDDPNLYFKPFATPRAAINAIDYSIGLLASSLIKDNGTLQVGIGSLGDALIYSTQLRHQNNPDYLKALDQFNICENYSSLLQKSGATAPFKTGLYAASEMFVEGFAHLYDAGILKRHVYNDAQIQSLINQGIVTEKIQANIIEILLKHNALDESISNRQLHKLQNLGVLKKDLSFAKGFIVDSEGQKYSTNLLDYNNIQAIQKNCLGIHLKKGSVLHAAFFLGSPWFYDWLHNLDDVIRSKFQMTAVSQVNELYGGEALDRVQRINARFINTCMKVDLLGAAASDTLDNNQVVSGVGGQYNFVAMGQTLADSRSILMLRSTHKGKQSNIVWKYPYCTIPRHLRDIVITEYGIADLRGQSDEECIKRMICIADSHFQSELKQTATRYNKLDPNWEIPKAFKSNTLKKLNHRFNALKQQDLFPQFPFGSDFTDEELILIKALTFLKNNTPTLFSKTKTILKAMFAKPQNSNKKFMKRMDLSNPKTRSQKINAKLLTYALNNIQNKQANIQ